MFWGGVWQSGSLKTSLGLDRARFAGGGGRAKALRVDRAAMSEDSVSSAGVSGDEGPMSRGKGGLVGKS